MKPLCTLVLTLLTCSALHAQEIPVDLTSGLDRTYQRNPRMQVAQERIVSASAQTDEVDSQLNPKVTFGALIHAQPAVNINTAPLIANTVGSTDFPAQWRILEPINTSIQMQLSMVLSSFGKIEGQVHAAEALVDASKANLEVDKLALNREFKTRFYNVLKAQAQHQVALLNLAATQDSLMDRVELFRQGLLARYDLTQNELQVTEAQESVAEAQTAIEVSTAQLRTLFNDPDDAAYKLASPPPIELPEQVEVSALQAMALTHRPELKVIEATRRSYQGLLESAQSQTSPTVTLSLSYLTLTGVSLLPRDQVMLGFNFQWALWDGGVGEANERLTESQIRSEDDTAEDTRNQIRLDVEQAWLNLLQSQYSLASARKQVEASQVYYDMAEERLKNGVGTALESSDALRSLNAARQNEVVANYNQDEAFATLEQALGVTFLDRKLVISE